MKRFEVVTVGNALKDIMFYSDDVFVLETRNRLPSLKLRQTGAKSLPQKYLAMAYGAKVPVKDVYITYGGGAMNVAVGLNNFGIKVAPLVNVGRDQMGFETYKYLHERYIDTMLVNFDRLHHTGFSVIITASKDKEHTIFTYKGAASYLEVSGLRDFHADWFYLSNTECVDWFNQFDKIVRQTKRGAKIAWNPGQMQLKQEKKMAQFLDKVELLTLNKDEAVELVRQFCPRLSVKQASDSKFLLKQLKTLGPKKILVTQGSRGVFAIDENDKFYYVPAEHEPKSVKETVGAGDAFSSGVLAGLIRWNDFGRALKLGVKNGGSVVRHVGSQVGLLKMKI
ncbi:MAG: PfkB family carbohydrate kinase [Parcubacteria group bacterium]